MILLRWLGWLLLFVALGTWAYEAIMALIEWDYRVIAGGELWARAGRNSLVGFQAFIEKQIWPWLWWNIVLPILQGPAWAIPLVPGFLLIVLFRRRRR